jgi:prepilin-type N-terminal cleavage/methylation domain-containing protein
MYRSSNRKSQSNSGFTIVELSLAIVMVSILTLAILLLSLSVMKIYSKGVTLKSVNQVSRDIGDQLTRDLREANPDDIVSSTAAGRLCLGNYSYVWNTPDMLTNPSSTNKYNGKSIRLTRFIDPSADICSSTSRTVNLSITGQEIIAPDSNIAIHSLDISELGSDTAIYSAKITLGTDESGTYSGTGGTATCKPPSDSSANFDFCTIRQFELVVKSTYTES